MSKKENSNPLAGIPLDGSAIDARMGWRLGTTRRLTEITRGIIILESCGIQGNTTIDEVRSLTWMLRINREFTAAAWFYTPGMDGKGKYKFYIENEGYYARSLTENENTGNWVREGLLNRNGERFWDGYARYIRFALKDRLAGDEDIKVRREIPNITHARLVTEIRSCI